MNNLFVNISTLPLLLIFFFVLKKMRVLKKEWSGPLSFVGFNIGLSSLIFLAFLSAPISTNTLLNPFIGFLFSCSLFIVGFIIVKVLKINGNRKPIFISSLVTLEGGNIGYPFFIASFLPPSLYPSVLAEGLNLSGNEKEYTTQLFSVTVFISIILLLIFSPFIPKLMTLW